MTRNIFKYISSLITIFVLAIAIFLIVIRFLGFTPYAIVSTSMAPSYNQGDIVYTKPIEFNDLEKGDTITFVKEENSIFVTHRVVDIDRSKKLIYTKGDNNNQVDLATVNFEDVVGKVIFKIPLLGYASTLFVSKYGRYIYLVVIVILLVLLLIPYKKRRTNNSGKQEN